MQLYSDNGFSNCSFAITGERLFLGGIHETEVLNEITQQTVKVTGRVVDSTGEPLSGAAIPNTIFAKGFQFPGYSI